MAKTIQPLDIPADLGSVGIGKNVARIGVITGKAHVTAAQAEHYFVGARLQVQFYDDPNAGDDVPGQQTLGDVGEPTITAVADVQRYSSSVDRYGFSLSFNHSLGGDLVDLASKSGRMVLTRTGDAGEAGPDTDSGGLGDGDPGFDCTDE